MSDATPGVLTDQHLQLFGAIVQAFARHEELIDQIIAANIGADASAVRLLTSGLGVIARRDALFRLLRHRGMPMDRIAGLRSYLKALVAFNPLRDDIVHSAWIGTKPQDAVWPAWLKSGPLTAVKPDHDIGHAQPYTEDDDEKVSYTLQDLKTIADKLAENHRALRGFAQGAGLLPPATAPGA